jgi:hypothetical protein
VHIDLPTTTEIRRLLAVEGEGCVSIYLPTEPDTRDADAERIAWKNLTAEALSLLAERGLDKRRVAVFAELFDEVDEDPAFWFNQARSLAAFTAGDEVRAYHLPNRLEPVVKVADRLFVKPLLRAVTFPQACFVLALAQGSVRLLEIGADYGPYEVEVQGMPTDAASYVGKSSISDRSPKGRFQGSEGQKTYTRQYARAVDRAVRTELRGHDLPLILAAAEPVDSIYRGVNTSDHLVDETIRGNPETTSDHELAAAAREILDRVYVAQVRELHHEYDRRAGQRRVVGDLADIARAATFGSVDTLVVDIDEIVRGTIDDEGALEFVDEPDGYDVVDEMARRVLAADGTVMAVRADDVPGGGPAAAVLRYA